MSDSRVLVVEDEWVVAHDIQASLEELGYQVTGIVASGKAAVQAAHDDPPDLILMDIVLQGEMDGIEAAQEIRSRQDLPVVFLTAYGDREVLLRAKATEPFGYLIKPFDPQTLVSTIEIALWGARTKRALREREEWLSTTLNCIGDAIIATAADDTILFLNPQAESLTGWTAEDATGAHLGQVLKLEGAAAGQASRGANALPEVCSLVSREGGTRIIEFTAAPLEPVEGASGGSVIAFRDVTERVRVERELEAHRSNLEELVAARTAELAESNQAMKREIRDRKRAEMRIKAALEEKEVLLAEIHDRVKNNLHSICGLLDLQAAYRAGREGYEAFVGCRNRVMAMALVHERLYQSPDLVDTNFEEFLSSLAADLFERIGVDPKRISLALDVGAEGLGVDAAIPCGLIVGELLSNALRHAFPADRRGEVTVSLRRIDEDHRELRVVDDGVGMPEDVDPNDSPTVGLPFVVAMAEGELGGSLDIERAAGTTVRLVFPRGSGAGRSHDRGAGPGTPTAGM